MSLPDIFFVAVLGLVIFGPKKLASIAPEAGKMLARWKKMSADFQSQLAAEVSVRGSGRRMEPAPAETSVHE